MSVLLRHGLDTGNPVLVAGFEQPVAAHRGGVGGVIPHVIDPANNRPREPYPGALTRAGIRRSLSGLISTPITQGISTHGVERRCWTAGITPIEIATGRARKEASRGRSEARRPRPGAEPYTPDRQPPWPRQCCGHGRLSRDQPGPLGGRSEVSRRWGRTAAMLVADGTRISASGSPTRARNTRLILTLVGWVLDEEK